MEPSEQFKKVVELGKRLVKDLDLEDSTDTLTRWMAHYVAELISTAEMTGNQADQAAAFETILKLWERRYSLPEKAQPVKDYEAILRTLKSLDPNGENRYFHALFRSNQGKNLSTGGQRWMELAEGLDYSAKLLIRFCLANAVENSLEENKELVEIVKNSEIDIDVDLDSIEFISDEKELINGYELGKTKQKALKDRLERLNNFVELSKEVSTLLQIQLTKAKQDEPSKG
jgi:hypothetical protein